MAHKIKKVAKKQEGPVIYDAVDEFLTLPEGFEHLCSALADDANSKPLTGQLRFLLNRQVLDLMRDIVDELEMSRELPVQSRDILITDEIVVQILQNERGLSAKEALTKAVGWYNRQKQQVQNDAIFVALTYYNILHEDPEPYKPGEVAFSIYQSNEEAETDNTQRPMPQWLAKRAQSQLDAPVRNMENDYERRLKQLFDMGNQCGAIWVAQFRGKFEEGMAKTIRLVEPRDESGFHIESSDSTLHAESGTTNGNS